MGIAPHDPVGNRQSVHRSIGLVRVSATPWRTGEWFNIRTRTWATRCCPCPYYGLVSDTALSVAIVVGGADSGSFAQSAREEYPIFSNQLPSFE
jgi:hypothetical protein